MTKHIKGIIFDLDGTLVDTLPDLTDAINVGLAAMGLGPCGMMEVRSWIGEGLPPLCRRAVGGDSNIDIDEMAAAVTRHYAEHRLDKTATYPGIPELLDALTERGVVMGILSNKPHLHTVPMTQALLERWHWIAVEGYQVEDRRKPDPRTALDIVSAMHLRPEQVMMVGDSDTDITTAINAGIVPVGVTWGYRDRPVLINAGPQHLIDRPEQLLDWI